MSRAADHIVPSAAREMPGSTSAKATVVALCGADGADGDGNRSGSVSAAAGEELGSRSAKRKKGEGDRLDRYRPSVHRAPSRRRTWSVRTLQTPAIEASNAGHRKLLEQVIDRAIEQIRGLTMAAPQSNRTPTKISQDSGQRLNSFMILSVTESDNQFPAENRDPRVDRQ